MGIFDFFKRKKVEPPVEETPVAEEKVVVETPVTPQETAPEVQVVADPTQEKIAGTITEYMDAHGIRGFSKEEMELVKPFFIELFNYFYEQAQDTSVKYCSHKGHELTEDEIKFALTSGKIFCQEGALDYVFSLGSNWHYYLGNVEAAVGKVPDAIQQQGKALQEQIDKQRAENPEVHLDALTQEEIFGIVMNAEEAYDLRISAMNKLTDIQLISNVAKDSESPGFKLRALELALPDDVVAELALHDTNYQVREVAISKLEDQSVLEDIAQNDGKRDLRKAAVHRLNNRKILKSIAQRDLIKYVREAANQRLSLLD